MLKFLIILVLIVYVFFKTAGFVFRLVFGNLRNEGGNFQNSGQHYSKRAPGSNLNIDKVPHPVSKKKSTYKGGEYVDYEEVN